MVDWHGKFGNLLKNDLILTVGGAIITLVLIADKVRYKGAICCFTGWCCFKIGILF